MAKPNGQKKRRTYDIPDAVLAVLDTINDDTGVAKDRIVAAGIMLFASAPPDLQMVGLTSEAARIGAWFELAYGRWAESVVEKMKRDGSADSKGNRPPRAKDGGKQ